VIVALHSQSEQQSYSKKHIHRIINNTFREHGIDIPFPQHVPQFGSTAASLLSQRLAAPEEKDI